MLERHGKTRLRRQLHLSAHQRRAVLGLREHTDRKVRGRAGFAMLTYPFFPSQHQGFMDPSFDHEKPSHVQSRETRSLVTAAVESSRAAAMRILAQGKLSKSKQAKAEPRTVRNMGYRG